MPVFVNYILHEGNNHLKTSAVLMEVIISVLYKYICHVNISLYEYKSICIYIIPVHLYINGMLIEM